VGLLITKLRKVFAKSVNELFFRSIDISQSYKQKGGSLMDFARLATTLLKHEERARDNHVLVCNFAKYSPIKKNLLTDSAVIFFLNSVINNFTTP